MNRLCRRSFLSLLAATAFVLANPGRAEAYRFDSLRDGPHLAFAADALRWDNADFPLRFYLQDNVPDYLDEDEWRDIVRDSFSAWSAIRTADIRLTLARGFVAGDGADVRDERLAIGWISPEDEAATFGGQAFTWQWVLSGRLAHCDIVMNSELFRAWLDEGVERPRVLAEIRSTILHEVGHCLGLSHTEPHPIPGWIRAGTNPPPIPSGFIPETIMSYGFGQEFVLTEDDRIGVSLLYPSTTFLASRGTVSGRLVREGGTVPFAYVQAVYPGARPRMGPGAFSDNAGYFHLEGLEPGTVFLWIHPMLIHYSNPHGNLLSLASEGGGLDIVDQWQWIQVTAGEIVSVPDIELATGRLP